MSAVELERLVAPIDDQSPSGPDLEYDPEFRDLELASSGRPEQQVGDVIVAAQEPDWRDVRKRAEALLGRTKDLRVAVVLARALVRTAGFVGFADGLGVLRGLVEARWGDVHPLLDPSDDNDPTMRINILLALCDPDAVLNAVRNAPLVISPSLGPLSLRDHAIASGEVPPPADASDDERPTMARFEAAFQEAPADQLTSTASALARSLEVLKALEDSLSAHVGSGHAVSFAPLQKLLWQASKLVAPRAEARSGGSVAVHAEPGNGAGTASNGHASVTAAVHGGSSRAGIQSRADVERAIDEICGYYERSEPSSPVPLLLKRAKRLVTMSFADIVKDLVPEGMNQLEMFRGRQEES